MYITASSSCMLRESQEIVISLTFRCEEHLQAIKKIQKPVHLHSSVVFRSPLGGTLWRCWLEMNLWFFSFWSVFVSCTEHWLRVRIRRTPYVDELHPQRHELYLGTGCPVSRVLPSFFEFLYTVSSCGIRKHVRTIINKWLFYFKVKICLLILW